MKGYCRLRLVLHHEITDDRGIVIGQIEDPISAAYMYDEGASFEKGEIIKFLFDYMKEEMLKFIGKEENRRPAIDSASQAGYMEIGGEMFKIIFSNRRTGRTTRLIEKCTKYNYALIVCPTITRARHVFEMARNMGKKIPMPITFLEFVEGRFYGKNIDAFLIDDLTVEVIADGCHLPKSLLQLIYKLNSAYTHTLP